MKKIIASFHMEAAILGEVEIKVEASCEHGQDAARNKYGYPTEMATQPSIEILRLTVDSTEMSLYDAAKMFDFTEKELEERCEEEAWEEYTDWS